MLRSWRPRFLFVALALVFTGVTWWSTSDAPGDSRIAIPRPPAPSLRRAVSTPAPPEGGRPGQDASGTAGDVATAAERVLVPDAPQDESAPSVGLAFVPVVEGVPFEGELRATLFEESADGRRRTITSWCETGSGPTRELHVHGLEPSSLDAARVRLRLVLEAGNVVLPFGERLPRRAALDLTHRLRPGRNDLGVVPLPLADVVLGGTVVDDREQPIPHARVTLARRVPWTEGTRRMEGERILALRKWPGLALTPLAETRADANGVFALRGEWDAPPEPYVFADADGHAASRPTPLAGPSSGLVLVAPRHGGVRHRLALDAGVRATDVEVHVDGRFHAVLSSADGRIEGLPPGVVDVAFVLSESDEPLALVPGVAVVPGGLSADPRLLPLDLRRGVSVLELRLAHRSGLPVAGAIVDLVDGGDGMPFGLTDDDGVFRWVSRSPPRGAVVTASEDREGRVLPLGATGVLVYEDLPPFDDEP